MFSRNIGTNETLKRWRWRTDAICPRCGDETETVQHVIQCNHPEATDIWRTSMQSTRTWMEEVIHTKPKVAAAITQALKCWRENQEPRETSNQEVQEAAQEQQQIGWWNMLMGLHSNRWQTIQQKHYQRIGFKRCAK